jgi:hypothetical protein
MVINSLHCKPKGYAVVSSSASGFYLYAGTHIVTLEVCHRPVTSPEFESVTIMSFFMLPLIPAMIPIGCNSGHGSVVWSFAVLARANELFLGPIFAESRKHSGKLATLLLAFFFVFQFFVYCFEECAGRRAEFSVAERRISCFAVKHMILSVLQASLKLLVVFNQRHLRRFLFAISGWTT